MGTTSAVAIGPDGATVWVAERCGETRTPDQIALGAPFACAGSTLDPILKFDTNGKLLGSFGAGMIVFPHAIHVDRDGNVWVADGLGYGGKGQQVLKLVQPASCCWPWARRARRAAARTNSTHPPPW